MSELLFRASDDRFQKIKNAQEYADLVEKFLTARETLKKNVRENKLGVSESEYQRMIEQKPTVEAIQRLENKLENIVPSTGDLVKSSKNKLEKKKDVEDKNEKLGDEGEVGEVGEEVKEDEESAAASSVSSASPGFLDDEKVNKLVAKYEAVKGPRGTLTVDKDDGTIGEEVVYLYPESRLVVVGSQKAVLTEPLLELLYLPGSQVLKNKYDVQTVNAFERLVSHIDKGSLGRSNKYQLILKKQELQKKALMRDKRSKARSSSKERSTISGRGASASKALATGRGCNNHIMIPQDVGEAAKRLNGSDSCARRQAHRLWRPSSHDRLPFRAHAPLRLSALRLLSTTACHWLQQPALP